MIGEFHVYGIYLPWLLVLGFITLAAAWAVRQVLARMGFYRLVWHPALFDAALYVVLLYGMYWISPFLFGK